MNIYCCHYVLRKQGIDATINTPGNSLARAVRRWRFWVMFIIPTPEWIRSWRPSTNMSSVTPYKPIPRWLSPVPLIRSWVAYSIATQSYGNLRAYSGILSNEVLIPTPASAIAQNYALPCCVIVEMNHPNMRRWTNSRAEWRCSLIRRMFQLSLIWYWMW